MSPFWYSAYKSNVSSLEPVLVARVNETERQSANGLKPPVTLSASNNVNGTSVIGNTVGCFTSPVINVRLERNAATETSSCGFSI